ncbi:MAG: YDG/SRA domain-containing protein [Candidatus Dormibacteraeota bacterium]|nr:YDG/SRA domain-containing protein [Candidatus Dormibacteraeota bacterium]
MPEIRRNRFRIPNGVDRVISVRPRWVAAGQRMAAGHMVIRIWHDGTVEDLAGPMSRAEALDSARAFAEAESTVYLRAPDDHEPVAPGALFGEPSDVVPGDRFRRRTDLRQKGVVRVLQQGIDYSREGAVAVVFSGGYADDAWSEEDPWYTGEGGQDASGRQVRDQELVRGNRALMRNLRDGLPVRVTRRVLRPDGDHEFVYEGLFHVVDFSYSPGRDGPKVYRFQLRRA